MQGFRCSRGYGFWDCSRFTGLEIRALGIKSERELGVVGLKGLSFLGPKVWGSMGL